MFFWFALLKQRTKAKETSAFQFWMLEEENGSLNCNDLHSWGERHQQSHQSTIYNRISCSYRFQTVNQWNIIPSVWELSRPALVPVLCCAMLVWVDVLSAAYVHLSLCVCVCTRMWIVEQFENASCCCIKFHFHY